MGFQKFWSTYIWVGQNLTEKGQNLENSENQKWYVKYKKIIGILIPCVVVWTAYFIIMSFGTQLFDTETDYEVWTEKFCTDGSSGHGNCQPCKSIARWWMGIVMIFGSLVAGATSEGAGAIAFPVMTLVFHLTPELARDFSLMSQSVGMSAAMFTIFYMRVLLVQLKVIIIASLAGIFGIAIGMELIAPNLPAPYIKMYFSVIWASFAIALYFLNRHEGRIVYDQIPEMEDNSGFHFTLPYWPGKRVVFNWKMLVIILAGLLGGIFTGMAGNGMDICLFSVLTLLFRVSEKTATPTSVVLMAINTVVGFAYRLIFQGGVDPEAWRFLAISTPIVVLGAPIGSYLGSNLSRLVLAWLIYIIDAAQLIGAIVIVKPWTIDGWILSTTTAILFLVAVGLFWLMSRYGLKLSQRIKLVSRKNTKDNPYSVPVKEGQQNEGFEEQL